MTRVSFILRVSAFALFVGPAALPAQSARKASGSGDAYSKALTLRAEAVELYAQPKRFVDAARLHVQEARFRNPRDPEAVEALLMAARLYNYAQHFFEARKVMEQAGNRALSIGDVPRAAHAYLDAAFISEKAHTRGEATRLARKAFMLSDSPLLTIAQRDQIRRRFVNQPHLAEATQ